MHSPTLLLRDQAEQSDAEGAEDGDGETKTDAPVAVSDRTRRNAASATSALDK